MTAAPRSAADEPGSVAHQLVDGALDDNIHFDGAVGHHLARVRRLRVGERLTIGDGCGRWRAYVVTEAAHGTLTSTSAGPIHCETDASRAVRVAPALSKGTKLETIVSQLTELGVARLSPWVGQRSVVRLDTAGCERLRERLVAAVHAAALQSRRSRLPRVDAVALGIDSLGAGDCGDESLLLASLDGDPGALDAIAPGHSLTIVTGPEGGIDPTERDSLDAMGAIAWRLGDGVLRAETAPLAAATLALA